MPQERRIAMETENKTLPVIEEAQGKKRKKKGKEKEKKTLKQEIMSWIWTLLAAVVIASLIRAYVAEPIRVDGDSMKNTLLDNEVVLVSKLDYLFGDMQRGDVVICRYPGRITNSVNLGAALSFDTHTLFVKRLVALPGDTVEIRNGTLYVNGEVVADPEHMGSTPRDYSLRHLGADEYFVMGDNRRTSHDSRADDVGPISKSAIMGKVKCVLLPFSSIRGVE